MRSESATVNGRSFLRPRAVFLFRHTSRLGGNAVRGRFLLMKHPRIQVKGSDRMYNVPVARKVCATCKWWRGKRELKFVGGSLQFVEVDGIMPQGHTCRAWNVERGATNQCNRWVKWEKM